MATTVARRVRRESPERWQAAFDRAVHNALDVFIAADTGERFVTSASQFDTLHRTDGYRCTCEAALAGDPICQHRALVRFVMGWLPEPPAAPSLPATISCRECSGGGVIYVRECELACWPMPECPVCKGTGTMPAPAALPVFPIVEVNRAAA